jgi:hypothetical protein
MDERLSTRHAEDATRRCQVLIRVARGGFAAAPSKAPGGALRVVLTLTAGGRLLVQRLDRERLVGFLQLL